MAGKQLGALARRLLEAGWPASTPVCVASRAGCSDMLHSDHTVQTLAQASLLHGGRPTVVTVGVGAGALGPAVDWTGHDLPEGRVETLRP
jgi:uroporphyrin-III C-methyltransferase